MIPADFGETVLRFALRDLTAGVREDIARNDGHRIREYAARFGLVPPLNWCAVAASTWLAEAAEGLRVPLPVSLSPAARGLMGSCIRSGRWVPWHKLAEANIAPGSLVVWWRGSRESWQGHVGIVERLDNSSPIVHTIEGNSGPQGDRVARMQRSLIDEHLLGMGIFGTAPHEPTSTELTQADRWKDLSHEVMIDGEPRDPLVEFDERHKP